MRGLLDASPYGRRHKHEAHLNFKLTAYNQKMLVDDACRARDCRTRSHNTVRIDALDQNRHRATAGVAPDPRKPAEITFSSTDARDKAAGVYISGYGPDLQRGAHARTVLLFKQERGLAPFFVIVDRIGAADAKEHTYDIDWHLPKCNLKVMESSLTGDFGMGTALFATCSDMAAKIVGSEDGPVKTSVFHGTFTREKRIVTVLYPYKDGAKRIQAVRASPALESKSFVIRLTDGTYRTLSEE